MTTNTTPALAQVQQNINKAARSVSRDLASVQLIAVSKTFAPSHILPILASGHRVFGENKVQEAQSKWPGLKAQFPDAQVHMIGPLQSNKAKEAVALFDAIHTIDRPKIAKAIAREMAAQSRNPQLFIQINTGNESQKAGVMPSETKEFVALCRDQIGLEIAGLMCIPPVEDMAVAHFAFLAKLAVTLSLPALSMGMSADYEAAVQLGASHVRVGSAIFGSR